jgi:L-ascorbate metabolism protein UlaG (beta-lactamase superfamily)
MKFRLIFCFFIFFSGLLFAKEKYTLSDHYDGKRFFQPGVAPAKSLFEVLKWKISSQALDWPKWIDDNLTPQLGVTSDHEVSTTFINHASHLIQFLNYNVLVDPIFSERASPVSFAGPKRIRAPGLKIDQLPKIDLILITHNHYDHLDEKSIRALAAKFEPLFITPLGNAKLLKKFGAKNVIELDWWQSHEIKYSGIFKLEVSCVPAQHWSARGIFDRNETLWSGFVLNNQVFKVFISGDTGYGPHFKEIQNRFGNMDMSIFPIGSYEPRWFMRDQHMNPREAVLAHLDVNSQLSVGSHFGTFQLTDEAYNQPEKDLKSALIEMALQESSFRAPKNGETIVHKK